MNNLDKQYTALLLDILDNGVEKKDRTGTGTLSVFGRQIRHKMSEGFPLLTTKKMHWKSIVTELLWFLRGDTNIKCLVDNDCHIWDGDAYKAFCKERLEIHEKIVKENPTCDFQPWEETITKEEFINKIKTDDEFARKWGDLGPVYGKQWRNWELPNYSIEHVEYGFDNNLHVDQIANLINDLKTNPDSRRLMVSAWNVGEIDQMTLPPCHYGFQVYTRELSLEERIKQIPYSEKHTIFEEKECIDELRTLKGEELQSFQKYIKEQCDKINIPTRAISLMWNQRSVDTFLGLPFNIASYGLLLEIIAKEVNMVPDELIGNLGDVHLYLNHIEQAKEQIGRELTDEERYNIWFDNNYETGMERFFDPNNLPDFDNEYYEPTPKRTREPYPLPKLQINDLRSDTNSIIRDITKWSYKDFQIEDYQSHPTIKAPLSN